MSIDIVMISSLKRIDMYAQEVDSLLKNTSAPDSSVANFVQVFDNPEIYVHQPAKGEGGHVICTQSQYGASRCRNIGASSIPKYRRGKYVMFCDDDLYFCPGWDVKMLELARAVPDRIISGHSHPFNHSELHTFEREIGRSENYPWEAEYGEPLVISTPHFMMPWEIWDDVGYFVEPGGPGGSEDFDYCMRAKAKGYGFAVSEPHCVIHCGLTSSNGKQIVGYDDMVHQNMELIKLYDLEGKIQCK